MGSAGFKEENFAEVSARANRLLLGEVAEEGFFSDPLGLEATCWDEEWGKV